MTVQSTQPILSRAFRANIPTTKSQTENILGVSRIWKHRGVNNSIRCSTPTGTFSTWLIGVGFFYLQLNANTNVLHRLEKNSQKDKSNRSLRRRCVGCYYKKRESMNSYEANKKTNKVNTFCPECPNSPFLCTKCFNEQHPWLVSYDDKSSSSSSVPFIWEN